MEGLKERLSGVIAPMTTPFKDDEVYFKGLTNNIQKMNQSNLRGYFFLGTNGEYKSLSVKERIELLRVAAEHRSPDKLFMAGTGMESTKETIEMTIKAAEIGADIVSLLMPHFFAKYIDDRVLIRYITEVADNAPVPVLIYNNPSVAAGICVSSEVIATVSEHPNVVGMKDSSKGNFNKYIEVSKEEFYMIAGSANFFLDLLKAGGIGGVLSLANIFPDECVNIYHAFKQGRVEEAERINEIIVGLNKVISGAHGVAGIKAAMDIVGFYGGLPRRPIFGITDSENNELKREIEARGFIRKN